MSSGRHLLELALRALLGRECQVIEGVSLAGSDRRVQLPPSDSEGSLRLALALQAALVGQEAPKRSRADAWHTTLLNLAVNRHIRARWPGLASAYASVDKAWWRIVAKGAADGLDPGALLLAGLLPHPELLRLSALPPAMKSQARAVQEWLMDSRSPPPEVKLAPPTVPLPYEATELRVPQAVPIGTGTRFSGSDRVLLAPSPTDASATRIVVLGPQRLHGAGAVHGESGSPGPTGPEADVIGELPCHHHEWDFESGSYREEWCSVYEVRPGIEAGADDLGVPPGAIRRARRALERASMRERRSRLEPDGVTPDIDAVVAAFAEDRLAGHERLFLSPVPRPGDTAVAVVADLSESTSGRTLELERAALALLGAALPAVGDEFCMLGFRGHSRDDCEVVWIKDLGERFGQPVRQRIRSLAPSGFTRISPCLRHVGEILQETECRNQMLLLMTDGMPYDCDGYGGRYAVEDTRRAFVELQALGVRSYCLTMESSQGHHLGRMFGPARWTTVAHRERLPAALLNLYARARF